jgi:thioredoxin reductase
MDETRQQWDVIVVGGGAAGLAGALALVRSRRSVLVVDAGEPRNAPAGHVHNFLTRDGTPPAELLATGRAEVEAYGGSVIRGRVHSASADDTGFVVHLETADSEQEPLHARRLLVTTGVTDRLPDVPGLAERWGRDVLHCPYCHGWEVRDQAIGVLNSPMAVHQALLFRQLSDDVVLFTHTGSEPTGDDLDRLAGRGIRVVTGEVAGLDVRSDALHGVRLTSGETVARQALVVAPRFRANADLLVPLGLAPVAMVRNDQVLGEHVPSDPASGATAVPGLYVAGNVTDPMAQVIGAANAGLRAGAVINADLVTAEAAAAMDRMSAAAG